MTPRVPSFPNSIWERPVFPAKLCFALTGSLGEGPATELPQQVRSQMEFGNEETKSDLMSLLSKK